MVWELCTPASFTEEEGGCCCQNTSTIQGHWRYLLLCVIHNSLSFFLTHKCWQNCALRPWTGMYLLFWVWSVEPGLFKSSLWVSCPSKWKQTEHYFSLRYMQILLNTSILIIIVWTLCGQPKPIEHNLKNCLTKTLYGLHVYCSCWFVLLANSLRNRKAYGFHILIELRALHFVG